MDTWSHSVRPCRYLDVGILLRSNGCISLSGACCDWVAHNSQTSICQPGQRKRSRNRIRNMNTIAIIIVSWNARNFLRQCLDSIRETSVGLKVEVVVVDNASTDGSPEMVLESFPEVKL